MLKHTSTKNLKLSAFTLSEVLITLGIIGIVASITLPSVIIKYQKTQTVTQLKKAYTVMSQAVKRAENDYGDIQYWDFSLSPQDFYKKYLKPYIVYSSEYLDNRTINYKTLNNIVPTDFGFTNKETPKIVLADGIMIAVSSKTNNNSKVIYVDTNSFKLPNRLGKDIFYFSIQPKYGFTPYGFNDSLGGESIGKTLDRDIIMKKNHYAACNKKQQGIWCAALIINDGWQIKEDYPW